MLVEIQDMEISHNMEIFHDMEIVQDMEIILDMVAKQHKLYCTTIDRRKQFLV